MEALRGNWLSLLLRARGRVVDEMSDGVLVFDSEDRLLEANSAAQRIVSLAPYRKPMAIALALSHHPELVRMLTAEGDDEGAHFDVSVAGERRWFELRVSRVDPERGASHSRVVVFHDITDGMLAESRIRNLSYYDSLTGLPNRQFFRARLDEVLRSAGPSEQHALLFIDLDGFKLVNDTLGQSVGDALLSEVARRFARSLRYCDYVARSQLSVESEDSEREGWISRLGGNEFTVLLSELAAPEDAAIVAQRILDALVQPIRVGGHELFAKASVGIAVHPSDGQDADTLVRRADSAMVAAKLRGANNYRFYSDALEGQGNVRIELESRLRRAIEHEDLILYHQPQRHATTGRVVGCEARCAGTTRSSAGSPPVTSFRWRSRRVSSSRSAGG